MQFLSNSANIRINGIQIAGRKREILRHDDVVSSASNNTIFKYKDCRIYTPDDIENLPDSIRGGYHFVTELGRGASATVFHVYCRSRLTAYAIKYIPKQTTEIAESGIKEASILRELEHCGITRLIRYIDSPESTILELELLHGGNLLKRIVEHGSLPEELCAFYFFQIAKAVEYLHEKKVTHRDIKPENILLKTAEDYTIVKLTDFGLAKFNAEIRTKCGTSAYVAPEVLKDGPYTEKVDVWSMGVVLYSALSGTFPFGHSGDQNTQEKIREGRFVFDSPTWQNVSSTSQNLIRLMMKKDAHERPSARRLLQEQWFVRYDKEIGHAKKLMEEERRNNHIALEAVTQDYVYVQSPKRHRTPGK